MRLATLVAMITIALSGGCSAGRSEPEPVAQCLEYQSALESCFHRTSAVASQTALLAQNDDDRARIGAMCSENLSRLRTSCR
jgi:hypothetical protein